MLDGGNGVVEVILGLMSFRPLNCIDSNYFLKKSIKSDMEDDSYLPSFSCNLDLTPLAGVLVIHCPLQLFQLSSHSLSDCFFLSIVQFSNSFRQSSADV